MMMALGGNTAVPYLHSLHVLFYKYTGSVVPLSFPVEFGKSYNKCIFGRSSVAMHLI